jgi:hypothetical protein
MTVAPMQLKLPGEKDADMVWMRTLIREWKLDNVTDEHLSAFWEPALGDKRMAVEAIRSVAGGKTYWPLRELLEAS